MNRLLIAVAAFGLLLGNAKATDENVAEDLLDQNGVEIFSSDADEILLDENFATLESDRDGRRRPGHGHGHGHWGGGRRPGGGHWGGGWHYRRYQCVAWDRGYEEHRAHRGGVFRDYNSAYWSAMRLCRQYHGHCLIRCYTYN